MSTLTIDIMINVCGIIVRNFIIWQKKNNFYDFGKISFLDNGHQYQSCYLYNDTFLKIMVNYNVSIFFIQLQTWF